MKKIHNLKNIETQKLKMWVTLTGNETTKLANMLERTDRNIQISLN